MKTRIIKVEKNTGKEVTASFFVERRILFFLWVSLRFPITCGVAGFHIEWRILTFSSKDQAERFIDIFITNPKVEYHRGMKIVRVVNQSNWELPLYIDLNEYNYLYDKFLNYRNVGLKDTKEMKERYDRWHPIETKKVV